MKKVILLYPLITSDIDNGSILEEWTIEGETDKIIQVSMIDYSSKEKTIQGLGTIIKSHFE